MQERDKCLKKLLDSQEQQDHNLSMVNETGRQPETLRLRHTREFTRQPTVCQQTDGPCKDILMFPAQYTPRSAYGMNEATIPWVRRTWREHTSRQVTLTDDECVRIAHEFLSQGKPPARPFLWIPAKWRDDREIVGIPFPRETYTTYTSYTAGY